MYPPPAPGRYVGKANTVVYPEPFSVAITPGTSGAYSAYVELIAAAANSYDRYVTSVSLQAVDGYLTSTTSALKIKVAIGEDASEDDIGILPLAWALASAGTDVGCPGATRDLAIPLTVSSGTRIAVAVTHLGSRAVGECRLLVEYAALTSVEGS